MGKRTERYRKTNVVETGGLTAKEQVLKIYSSAYAYADIDYQTGLYPKFVICRPIGTYRHGIGWSYGIERLAWEDAWKNIQRKFLDGLAE